MKNADKIPHLAFKCKALGFSDPPQECDWPMCACDPYAAKVLGALMCERPSSVSMLQEIHDPQVDGFWKEGDVPMPLQRELLQVAVKRHMSFYYLCAIYRQGRLDTERRWDEMNALVECPACEGSGHTPAHGHEKCGKCEGEGTIQIPHVSAKDKS